MKLEKFSLHLCWLALFAGVSAAAPPREIGTVADPGADGAERVAIRQLSHEDAIRLALKQNAELLGAREEIARTLGLVVEVRGQALPQLNLAGEYRETDDALREQSETPDGVAGGTHMNGRGGGGLNTGEGGDRIWNVAIEASQLIYSGGKVSAATKIARFTRDQSYYALRETINNVVARVTREYYAVVLAQALVTVQEENLELLRRQLQDQENRFKAGSVPEFNVIRARVELAGARPDLIRARNDQRLGLARLARTLGVTIAGNLSLTDGLRYVPAKFDVANAIVAAKQNRPLLKQRRQQMLIEAQQIRVELADYQPRIDAIASYEARNTRLRDDIDEAVYGWFVGIRGRWKIFDGFETAGRVRQARARLERARIDYDDAVRQVELEVREAHSRWMEASEIFQSQREVVAQAREALRLAQARLDAGAGTQLELFDARVALTRAQVTQLESLFEHISARSEMQRVMGVGIIFPEAFDDPLLKSPWVEKLRRSENTGQGTREGEEPASAGRQR